jgi:NADH-quinone oxidoreductase subunit H
LSQITLPWVEKDPLVLGDYRRKAGTRLAALGIFHIAAFFVLYWLFDLGATNKIWDYKIICTFLALGALMLGLALTGGALVLASYRQIGRFLLTPWVAFSLFVGGIIATCLIVWLHSVAFEVARDMVSNSRGMNDERTTLGFTTAELTSAEIYTLFGQISPKLMIPMLAYAFWPLQFSIVRDLVAVGAIIGFINIVPVFGIWWERKVAGRIQSRLGPMRVGGWHGWAQSPADGIKLLFKEDTIPPEGDQILFRLAVHLAFVPAVCAFIALPFAGAFVFRDLDVGLLFILAMLGIEVVGVILAGWASNNKWSVYGAMREACQMVSYEIPMGMSLLIPVMLAGTLQLTAIADKQSDGFASWFIFANPFAFIAFFTYYTASLASCKRAPFDLPESESELVAGFHTEYSGFRWSLFFFGEYAAMFVVSGLAVILFLGGWKSPFPADWAMKGHGFFDRLINGIFFEGPILFILKSAFLYYVQLWIRWTLPRIRIDQVLYACIQVLLPLTMIVLLGNTLWILFTQHLQYGWMIILDKAFHMILVAIGATLLFGMFGIAWYGYANRRTLPGSLVVDHLPGA